MFYNLVSGIDFIQLYFQSGFIIQAIRGEPLTLILLRGFPLEIDHPAIPSPLPRHFQLEAFQPG